jgi:hypothetical protein
MFAINKYYILAFLSGISAKVYDDLDDNALFTLVFDTYDKLAMESLKMFQIITLTIFSLKYYIFSIYFYIANLLNYIGNNEAYSRPYEMSLVLLFPVIFLFLNYGIYEPLTYADIFICLSFLLGMYAEPLLVRAEISVMKLYSRVGLTIYYILLAIIGRYIKISEWVKIVIYYNIGYLAFSSLFQYLSVYTTYFSKSEELC